MTSDSPVTDAIREQPAKVDQLLLWASGANVSHPPFGPDAHSQVVDRLQEQCLLGRYIARCEDARAADPLVGLVRQRQQAVERQVRLQSRVLVEIASQPEVEQVAVMKGMATFALTGDRASIRTGDIDIVSTMGRELPSVLSRLGFEQTRSAFGHELGEYVRDGVEVDVHDFFPVTSPPAEATKQIANRGRTICAGRAATSRLNALALLSTSRQTDRGEARGISTVGIEAQTAILAAHAFMNYTNVWSISHRAKPYIRLGELLDIELLLSDSSFDHDRFEDLVESTALLPALEFVSATGRALLDRPLVSGIQENAHLPPRCFWWNLWLAHPARIEQLLRKHWFCLDDLLEKTGVTYVRPNDHASALDGKTAGVLSTSAGAACPWVAVNSSGHATSVSVSLGPRLPVHKYRVRVDGGTWATEWSSVADQATGHTSGDAHVEVIDNERGRQIVVAVPRGAATHALVGLAIESPDGKLEATLGGIAW